MVYEYLSPFLPFFITSLVSFFVIIDPTGNIFAFLALAAGAPAATGRHLAGRACCYSFVILALFALAGRFIIDFFGISLAAFQIAGGLILFRISFDMLQGQGHFNRLDTASSLKAEDYGDIALVPLAVPLMAGPGSITTALVLASRAQTLAENLCIILAAAVILVFSYLCFRYAERIVALIKESSLRLLTRIMGLILTALAVEFVIQGLRSAFPLLHQ